MNMIYQNIDYNPMSNYFASFIRSNSKSCESNLDSNKCLITKKSKTCEIDVKNNFKKASVVEGLDQRTKKSKSRKGKKSSKGSKRKHGSSSKQLTTLRTSKKSRISKKSSKKKRKIKEKIGKEVVDNHCECTEIKCKNNLTQDDRPVESTENYNEEKKVCGCSTLFGRVNDSANTNIDDDKKGKRTKEEKRSCSCNKEKNSITNLEDCPCGVKNLISFECHLQGDGNTDINDSVRLIKVSLENKGPPRRKRGKSVSIVDRMKRSQVSKTMSLENGKIETDGKCIYPPSLGQRNRSKHDECPNVVYNPIPNPFIQWKRQRRFSKSVDACNCGEESNEVTSLDDNCQQNKKIKAKGDKSAQKNANIEAEEMNNTCLANCRENNSYISIKSKKVKNLVQPAKLGKTLDTKPVKLAEPKPVKPPEIKQVKLAETKPLKLPEVKPVKPQEIKQVKPPEPKPVKPAEAKPLKLPEVKPVKHQEIKQVKPPEPKPVKPAEAKPLKLPEVKPVKRQEIKQVKQSDPKILNPPRPKAVKHPISKPLKPVKTVLLKPVKLVESKLGKHADTKLVEPVITFSKEMNIEKYKKCCGVYEPPVKFDNIPNYCYRDPLDLRLVHAWNLQTWCFPRRYGL